MARLSRAFLDYSCYHIIVRGNQKQNVFIDNEDFSKYLYTLKKAKRKYKIMLYSYCLMPNHVHLLIEVEKVRNMSKFMHWLNRGYAEYFNVKYQKVGHVWQGRFKSKPILKGQYLVHCANYIECNPIRANITDDIINYEWSSYKERCLLSKIELLDELLVGTVSPLNSGTG